MPQNKSHTTSLYKPSFRAKKRKIKIRERCANVFVTMPRYNKDARLGALGEFLGKNSPNALCNIQILGI
ncbi:hypothetical protein AGF18_22800 [Klebsiella oxytoca]|nr:hypothetical protein AGF18_22800 [Klebsiella oxytoca]AVL80314.1 hypothetical protein CEQ13_09105 [Klebsiella oxytoca]